MPTRERVFTAKQETNLPALAPEVEAAVVDQAGERFARVRALAAETGLKPEVLNRLIARMRARYQPVLAEMQEFKTRDILGAMEDRIGRALLYLDDYAMAAASAKDLAVVLGILLEKRQLLRGEPTAILSVEERQGLGELIPRLIAEAQRRGMGVDCYGGEPAISPPAIERMMASRSTQRNPIAAAKLRQLRDADAIGEPRGERRGDSDEPA